MSAIVVDDDVTQYRSIYETYDFEPSPGESGTFHLVLKQVGVKSRQAPVVLDPKFASRVREYLTLKNAVATIEHERREARKRT